MEKTTERALSTTVGRRSFLKMAAVASVFGATSGFAPFIGFYTPYPIHTES